MAAYLDLLEGVLSTGLEALSPALKQAQVAFVLSRQGADGGFRGRLGRSDLYYTDFAVRLLALVAPDAPALARVAEYLAPVPPEGTALAVPLSAAPPSDVIQCFNLLNCRRLLTRCGLDTALDPNHIRAVLQRSLLPTGGAARPGHSTPSAYHTFLAALCFQILDEPLPQANDAVAAIARLQGPDGGFREQLTEGMEQTNATAAAAAFLLLEEALTDEQAHSACSFLTKLQASDGGFLAHAAAPCSDLLSTFTALATLAGLDGFEQVNLPALARFLRQTASPAGGFKAAPADTEPDVEYTYYGLASLALIQASLA